MATGPPVVHGGDHGPGGPDWSEEQYDANVARLARERVARSTMADEAAASALALRAALGTATDDVRVRTRVGPACAAAAAADDQARALAAALAAGDLEAAVAISALPPTQPETLAPTPEEVIKMERAAMKEFVTGIAQLGWKRWTQNQIKALQEAQLDRMAGRRRTRFLTAIAEMVQMVANGAAQGGHVEINAECGVVKAAGAKTKLLNEVKDLQSLMDAMTRAIESNWPAEQLEGMANAPDCGGVSKADVMTLVRTALHWSYAGADAAKPTDAAFAQVSWGG